MSEKGKLKVATCQFPVSSSIEKNSKYICDYIRRAANQGAEIVHFSECALSGYVGTDFPNFDNFDWALLAGKTAEIMELAGKLGIWVILGTVHQREGSNKPYNSLYVINSLGSLVDRYDKRFCTPGDLKRHTPGNQFVYFDINGVRCTVLICFDLRFPELYRELFKNGVNFVLQSFYNAGQKGVSVHKEIMRQTMQTRAAENFFWVSMSNSSKRYSPYPSCFIEPDGRIAAQLKFNQAGMMVNMVDLGRTFYDPMIGFREMAMRGKLNNEVED